MGGYQTVVVGTDGSETSLRAVDRAAALARDADATLVIACAYFPSHDKNLAHDQDVLGADAAYQVVGSAPAEDTVSRARDRAAAAGATKVETVAVEGTWAGIRSSSWELMVPRRPSAPLTAPHRSRVMPARHW